MERGQPQAVNVQGGAVTVNQAPGKSVSFNLDAVLDSRHQDNPGYASQERVYESFGRRMVDHAVEGYTSTIFAYGQTGTGKTTTMMGKVEPASEQGLLPRLVRDLFESSGQLEKEGYKCNFLVQMLEVYNEQLRDLLAPDVASGMTPREERRKPEVHVHPKVGVYVTHATEAVVESFNEVVQLLEYGNAMKMVASTAMNRQSSRAHTIFKLHMEKRHCSDGVCTASDIYCVDLAGRENERTAQVAGQRLVELSFINRSLMWLAECIKTCGDGAHNAARSRAGSAMSNASSPKGSASDGRRQSIMFRNGQAGVEGGHAKAEKMGSMAKFRNSKLTLLLANALSGNSRTAMIGTLGPSAAHVDETLSTLNFAATVKNIRLSAAPCSSLDKDALLRMLQKEVEQLREQLKSAQGQENIEILAKRAEATETLSVQHTMTWDQKRRTSLWAMQMREATMQKMSIARWDPRNREVSQPSQLPYLANESDDPQLCGMLVFHIPPDGQRFSIGATGNCDFRLLGLDLCADEARPTTCYLRNDNGNVKIWDPCVAQEDKLQATLTSKRFSLPASSALAGTLRAGGAQVNGEMVGWSPVELVHGDLVHIGRHAFRVYTRRERPMDQRQESVSSTHSGSESSSSSGGSSDDDGDRSPRSYATPREGGASERGPSDRVTSAAVAAALGDERAVMPGELDAALVFCLQFQLRPGCGKSAKSVKAFLERLAEAQGHVAEANAITEAVKPKSGLRFEVAMQCPVLSQGYGPQAIPEVTVRLEQHAPRGRGFNWGGITREVANRGETDVDCAQDRAGTQMLCVWNLEKFQSRLLLMRDAYESFLENPKGYWLDPLLDPWTEYGPAEIAELQENHRESLAAALLASPPAPAPAATRSASSGSASNRCQASQTESTPRTSGVACVAGAAAAALNRTGSGCTSPRLSGIATQRMAQATQMDSTPRQGGTSAAASSSHSVVVGTVPHVPGIASLRTPKASWGHAVGAAGSSESRPITPRLAQGQSPDGAPLLIEGVSSAGTHSGSHHGSPRWPPQSILQQGQPPDGATLLIDGASSSSAIAVSRPGSPRRPPQTFLQQAPPRAVSPTSWAAWHHQRHTLGSHPGTVAISPILAHKPQLQAPLPASPSFHSSWGLERSRSAEVPLQVPIQAASSTCDQHRDAIARLKRALDGFLVAKQEISVTRRAPTTSNPELESTLRRKVLEARTTFELEASSSPESSTRRRELRAEFELLQTLADDILLGNVDKIFARGTLSSLTSLNCSANCTKSNSHEAANP